MLVDDNKYRILDLEDKVDLLLDRIMGIEKQMSNGDNKTEVQIIKANYPSISKSSSGVYFLQLGTVKFNPNENVVCTLYFKETVAEYNLVTNSLALDNNTICVNQLNMNGTRTLTLNGSFTSSTGEASLCMQLSTNNSIKVDAEEICLVLYGKNMTLVR